MTVAIFQPSGGESKNHNEYVSTVVIIIAGYYRKIIIW